MTTTAPVPGDTPMPSAVEIARAAVRTGTRIAPSVAAELLAEYDRRGAEIAHTEELGRQALAAEAAAVRDLEAEIAWLHQVIREYVAHIEDGHRFDALVDAVPGLESDDGVYPTGEL